MKSRVFFLWFKTTISVTSLVLLMALGAKAQTLTSFLSNLNQAVAGSTVFYTPNDLLAQSFVTPTTSINSFLYVKMNLELLDASVSSSDSVHAYLYTDGSGTLVSNGTQLAYLNADQPLSLVADLGMASVSSTTSATYTFSSSTLLSLNRTTVYWIVLQDDVNSNVGWDYTNSLTKTGTGAYFTGAGVGASPDNGVNWLIQGISSASGPQRFEVGTFTPTITPEPASLSLFALGGICTMATFRRRRRMRTENIKRLA